jgi:MFS family permease
VQHGSDGSTKMTAGNSGNPWRALSGNDQFRWLLAGNTTLFFGFFATVLLRSLLAWELTQDEMSLAYINLVTAVCMFVTSIFSGTVIDSFERRRLMFCAQSIVFAAESIILVLLITDRLTFGFLMMSAAAASCTFPFIMPARTAMLVESVGRPRLGKANALMSAGINIARMVSPALVGIFADILGMVACYIFLLALHMTSLLCTFKLRNYPPSNVPREGFVREIKKGFAYIFEHRSLGLCMLFGIMPMLVVVPLQNLMVVFVDEIWERGGSGLGIMMAAMGIGGLVGSLLMALLNDRSLVKPMVLSALLLAGFLLLFGQSPYFWLAVVMVAGIYACSVFTQTLVHTSVQLMSEDYIRGRITTITMMSFGLAPLGTIPLAFATKHLGGPWAMSIAATLLLVGVALMWSLMPSFRRLDEAARLRA